MDDASAENRLEIVKWLHENRREGCTKAAMDGATRRGYINMILHNVVIFNNDALVWKKRG
jgi:hypothetical protein